MLLDIGGGTSSIIIFSEGAPVYSSVLPMGGQNITNDLAIGLRTSLENAEKVKLKLSDSPKEEPEINVKELSLESGDLMPKKFLTDIIRCRLQEIFSLVALEIKKANYTGKLPAGLVVCGGASRTFEVEQTARFTLKMPVRLGTPRGATGLIDEITGPAYSAGVGAILYGQNLESSREGGSTRGKVANVFGKVISWVRSFLP